MKPNRTAKIGTILSLGCAVHCLSFPIVIPFIPVVGKELLFSHTTESIIIIFAVLFGIISLLHGYRKHHHKFIVFPIFILGAGIIITGQLMHPPHEAVGFSWSFASILLIAGGILMGTAQIINYTLQRKYSTVHSH